MGSRRVPSVAFNPERSNIGSQLWGDDLTFDFEQDWRKITDPIADEGGWQEVGAGNEV